MKQLTKQQVEFILFWLRSFPEISSTNIPEMFLEDFTPVEENDNDVYNMTAKL